MYLLIGVVQKLLVKLLSVPQLERFASLRLPNGFGLVFIVLDSLHRPKISRATESDYFERGF